MFKAVSSLFAVSLAVAVLGVSDAHATTFCVPNFHAACPNNGTNVAQANLETAMQSNATDGIADEIIIDAGTFTDPVTWDPNGSDALTIRGAGVDSTDLTSNSNSNTYVVNLANNGNTRNITMRDLTIVIPASMLDNGGAAIQISGDTLEDVDIESRNPGSSGASSWIGGGTFRGGRVYATGAGTIQTAFRTDGNATGTVDIEDARIDAPVGGVSNTGPGIVNVRRSHITQSAQSAVSATNGTTHVENTVIESKTTTTALFVFGNSANNVAMTADHVTAVSAGGNAAAFSAQVGAFTGNASMTVQNSIARNYGATYLRQAQAASANGNADMTIRYSNTHPTGLDTSTGDGTLSTATGNIDADPQFTSATAFSLKPGSPSIDAGDAAAGGLTQDFVKALRPVDGNADGTAVRDQGAYEYQPPAPPPADPVDPDPVDPANPQDPADPVDPADPSTPDVDSAAPDTIKGKGPKAKIRKESTSFEFSSEPGAGFECALDGKALGACTSPMKVKGLKRGKHVFTAAAVDAVGNVDETPASWTFRVVKRKRH
jgi:hypothetical protein